MTRDLELEKVHLLREFQLTKEEYQSYISPSPICEEMTQSINTIGNQNSKKSREISKMIDMTFLERCQTLDYQEHRIVGKRPSARDGHSFTQIAPDRFLVFGGDRHMMQYNDTFVFDMSFANSAKN